jgi:pyrroloquinoline quinone biosynthesis protein B
VHVLLMGTAAGGGFPQWNCWCPCCQVARRDPTEGRHRTQSSAAISLDGLHWFLLNASPDVREQLGRLPSSGPPATLRHVPIEGVLLTDAELDHSLGVALLREARYLPLYTTDAIGRVLADDSKILAVARAFADVPLTELPLRAPLELRHRDGTPSGLVAEAFTVAAGPPMFAPTASAGHTIGLMLRDPARGHACAFVPSCGELDAALLARLAEADVLLFDGTFWTDRELLDLGISTRTAREMDHLPVGGPGGSLEQLAALPCRHRIFTHINNTNPMLLEHSPEREAVVKAGLIVGFDGLAISL